MSPSHMVGKYRLLAELGQGGMARVYLALATGPAGFNKLVVIKQIQAHLADDPEFLQMFLDEARLAARLNHANIVQTNEVGEDPGGFYLAMEFLEGQSFRRILNHLGRGGDARLSLPMKLRVVIDALTGLQYAHDLTDYDGSPLGVVHRDVSPDNVFVTYDGVVKVVDFGIAKAVSSSVKTATGVLKGKVAYMAPEQAMAEAIDRRADVFSMGAILWELAAGRRLFKGIPDMAILHQLNTGYIPRPSTHDPSVDPAFEAIVMRALAVDPDARYASADDLAQALRQLLASWGDATTCREVGQLVASHFAAEREQLRGVVDEAVQDDDRSGELLMLELGATGAQPATPPPSAHQPATRVDGVTPASGTQPEATSEEVAVSGRAPGPASSGGASGPSTSASVVMPPPVPPRSSGVPWWLVAVGAITVGGVAAVLVTRVDEPVSDPAPAAASEVELRIESKPAGATVRCGDDVAGTTPVTLRIPAGQPPCPYLVELDGYAPYRLERGPLDANTTVAAMLEALPAASPSSAVGGASSSPAGPKTTAAPPRPKRPPVARPPVAAPPPPPPVGGDIRMTR